MSNNLPQEMVYTITSGFYPKLFSKDGGFRSDVGGGRKGMQWKGVKGFTEGSLDKVAGKRPDEWEQTGLKAFFQKLKKGAPWEEAASKYLSTSDEADVIARGEEKDLMSQKEMEEKLTWTKFMGNNDTYKLWGSRVWYQHGIKSDPEKITESLNQWDEPNKGSYLTDIYKKKEKDLIAMAMEMAKKIFGSALDEENLRSDLESVGKEAHVPEEERKELKGAQKVNAIPKKFREVSQARQVDAKLRMKKGSSLYVDSTEMPLHQANQHGITEKAAKELGDAIKRAKEKGGDAIEELRQVVVKVFIKNIDFYNKSISKLVHKALPDEKDKKKGMEGILKIMKNIKKENKKKGFKNPKASVAQIAKVMGVNMSEDSAEGTALKYIIHTITNLAGKANKNFRQGHFAGVFDGQNMYASVPMQLKTRKGKLIPQFLKSVVTAKNPNGVLMLQGENHSIALSEKFGTLKSGAAVETKMRQIQAFQNGKIIGVGANNQQNAKANANMGLSQECRQSTVVTFNPENLKDLLDKIPETVKDNVGNERLKGEAEKFMGRQTDHKLTPKGLKDAGHTKFWALPYLGLMEYPMKSE